MWDSRVKLWTDKGDHQGLADKGLGGWIFKFLLYTFIYLYWGLGVHMPRPVWRSEDNLSESVLSFHRVCLRDQTQVVRLVTSALTHRTISKAQEECLVGMEFQPK